MGPFTPGPCLRLHSHLGHTYKAPSIQPLFSQLVPLLSACPTCAASINLPHLRSRLGLQRLLPLLLGVAVDAAAVLRALVAALAVERGRVVLAPEHVEQLLVGHQVGVVHNLGRRMKQPRTLNTVRTFNLRYGRMKRKWCGKNMMSVDQVLP